MFDLFVCTNEVNYTVALAGELRRRPRRAIVLFDPVRSEKRHAPSVWQLPFDPWVDRLLRALGRLRLLDTAYVPHLRFSPRLKREVLRARRLAYLDDGLDTLRRRPMNLDLDGSGDARAVYLTFREYEQLPQWLQAFDVQRVCSLLELPGSGRKSTIDLRGANHLFVESPGLDVVGVIAALQIDPSRALCVRHPVPHKRTSLPEGCATIEGRGHDLEATLLAARGLNLYFGSTMALVFALLTESGRHNQVHVQLDEAQRTNLLLPGSFEELPLPGLRHPLRRAIAGGTAHSVGC